MNKTLRHLALAASLLAGGQASATVVATFGQGSAVWDPVYSANFGSNITLSNNYAEGGLLFSYTGSANNNGCGYAGIDCYDDPSELSPAFAGNYMATAGNNAYISIRRTDGSDFYNVEFAAGTGYLNLNGYWKTYNNGVQTGSGNFSKPDGAILGLADVGGFDEVRYYAFATANRTSGFSAAAIDDVRVGLPEPASVLLMMTGLIGLGGLRRRSR
ncbi:VPLPA-CTERM sorting domain-containing protein [Duganella sp. FT92W]|uniref:VPLPA-CTERM sorting domain-containing protein n=1 Tax=Pseudoduganella rivuli TaxID=2666085 RepID=A0A7X2ISP9_9BURK|nr:VPLPA-CTERM sorting domain-containing protein [Pseudoduganella rivuli]MRV74783.1 VPLPA-CTERM sorting domain-containing protein [Pseudoduganella rivuli]